MARPFLPPMELVTRRASASYERGQLTNGVLVRQLEEEAAAYLRVGHVVAVASCTSGLMLAIRALRPRGPVVLPSFTFSASAHAVAWNGLAVAFCDVDLATCQIDAIDAGRRVSDLAAGAVLATHVFGAPCKAERVERLARAAGIPVIFDAAHAFGATRVRRRVGGFGSAEVFSMSPTKLLVAGEGGLVATDDAGLAEEVRLGRDYGNPGDYNTRFVGLNARLSEFHAATALESLRMLDEHLERRRAAAGRYAEEIRGIDGVEAQVVDPADTSTYKDFTVRIDPVLYGLTRDELVAALAAEGVETRCYFDPPVHRQQAYAGAPRCVLPLTDRLAAEVISLPMFGALETKVAARVAALVAELPAAMRAWGPAVTTA
ncbi:MAG: DegT/DnrJ/EryC1/StrS family aminotransferase [Acidimicrobiales bacterium]